MPPSITPIGIYGSNIDVIKTKKIKEETQEIKEAAEELLSGLIFNINEINEEIDIVNQTLSSKEDILIFNNGLLRQENTITNDLITGKAGGQTIIGGTQSGDNLTLKASSHETDGLIEMLSDVFINNKSLIVPKQIILGVPGEEDVISDTDPLQVFGNMRMYGTLFTGETGLLTLSNYSIVSQGNLAIASDSGDLSLSTGEYGSININPGPYHSIYANGHLHIINGTLFIGDYAPYEEPQTMFWIGGDDNYNFSGIFLGYDWGENRQIVRFANDAGVSFFKGVAIDDSGGSNPFTFGGHTQGMPDGALYVSNHIHIGAVTPNPDGCAILRIESTSKGLLPPRMSNLEAEAIADKENGLIVYVNDASEMGDEINTVGLYCFVDSNWSKLN